MSEAKACILSVSGQKLTSGERALLSDAKPWGVILMGRSCGSPEQVRGLVDEMWGAIGRPVLVFIDQEGGRVARLKPPNWPTFPPAARYGEIYRRNRELGIEASWLGHRLLAAELEALGIHADCAPDVDLLHAGAHSVIGDRSFGAEPEMVGVLAKAALEGWPRAGSRVSSSTCRDMAAPRWIRMRRCRWFAHRVKSLRGTSKRSGSCRMRRWV